MTDVVLDASAILARVFWEPGADRVAAVLEGAWVSAVNLAEVARKLVDRGLPRQQAEDVVRELPCVVATFDAEAALGVALLRPAARSAGLSLADRACLDLARRKGFAAFTTDRAWADLDLGVEVVLIR